MYWTTLPKRTAAEVFHCEGVTIAQVKRAFGEDGDTAQTALLGIIVAELVQAFNVGKTMDGMQVAFTVNGIKEDYWFIKLEALKLCFDNAKKGKYGTMYDRIDAAVIFGWIDKFLDEQVEIAAVERQKENKQHSQGTIHLEYLKTVSKNLEENKKIVDMSLIEPKPRELTEQEKFIQDCFKEFDETHRTQSQPHTDTCRMVVVDKKSLTQNEFVLYKLEKRKDDSKNKKDKN